MIQKYKKKPIVIEAARLSKDNVEEISAWCGGNGHRDESLFIKTLEGVMEAKVGDYIIKGLAGEFYPCRADIFDQTYSKVEEAPSEPPADDVAYYNDVTYYRGSDGCHRRKPPADDLFKNSLLLARYNTEYGMFNVYAYYNVDTETVADPPWGFGVVGPPGSVRYKFYTAKRSPSKEDVEFFAGLHCLQAKAERDEPVREWSHDEIRAHNIEG